MSHALPAAYNECRVLMSMGPINHLPLRHRLFRAVAGACREIAGAKPAALQAASSHAATRRFGATGNKPTSPLPPPRRPVLGCRGQLGGASGGLLSLDRDVSRKRPLGRRLLSTRASALGGEGGDINIGRSSSSSAGGSGSPCWKCKSIVGPREYFCECGAAQLLDGRLDYFEMFDCPPSVFLELKEVEKRFKNMQRAFHPDLFASKCEDEQEISAANSASVNKAYQTLVEPMSRVRYLMRLLGSTALEEEGADDRTPVPMDFLMEVMETRESLEKSSSQDEVEAISAETTAAINECLQDMDEALKAGGGKEELSDAAVRLRYLHRIQKEAQRVLHGLEDSRASPDAGSA